MKTAIEACERCLRRGELVGRLSAPIAALLDRRGQRPSGLLGLPDEQLIAAVAGRRADEQLRRLSEFSARGARAAIADAGLGCVCRHSDRYPPGLMELADPPAALYVAGSAAVLAAAGADPVVTIVGGRRATPYGLEVARALGRGLAAAGALVVSGLALGVDGAAHRGGSGRPDRLLAVLGCGADVPYPARHRDLYERLRSGGAVVSELPPGTRAARWAFPARNRIMAGLGRMTVVVEAREGSGSLITAAFAGDLGREVGAVPGRVTTAAAVGSNRLLHDGARVVRGPEDVLDALYGVGAGHGERSADGSAPPGARTAPPGAGRAAGLDPPLGEVLEAIEAGQGAEAIGRGLRLEPGAVRAALGRLELLGLINRDGLGLYERRAGA